MGIKLFVVCIMCVLILAEIKDTRGAVRTTTVQPRTTTACSTTTTAKMTTTSKPSDCRNTRAQCRPNYHLYNATYGPAACLPYKPNAPNQTIYYVDLQWCGDDCPASCTPNPSYCGFPTCPPVCNQCNPPLAATPAPHCTNNAYECPQTHRCDVGGNGTWCLVYSGDQTKNVTAPVNCSDNCPSTCAPGRCIPCQNTPGHNWCNTQNAS